MTMTPEQQRAIIEKESEWIDRSFSQLDLSAFPALNELPPDHSADDGKFARAYGDTALRRSAQELRSFLESPDLSAMEESGSADLLHDVQDQRAELVVHEFRRRCPGYLPTDSNYRSLTLTLAYNALPPSAQNADADVLVDRLIESGHWTPENLEACFLALDREGLMDKPAGEPRNLSERERLRVARLGQSGQLDAAIGEFLRCSLDGDEPGIEMINDPRYRGLCDDAVYFVFSETQLDFVETGSRKAYLLRYAGSRPLTIPLLQQAWKSCQENEKRRERGELLNQIGPQAQPLPVTEAQLDSLDDSGIDRLYHDSLKAYAASVRAHGMLV